MRKNYAILLAASLVLTGVLIGCTARAPDRSLGAAPPEPVTLPVRTPLPEPLLEQRDPLSITAQQDHPALMDTDGNGSFYPERTVTKAELCGFLAPMLSGLPAGEADFTDYRRGNAGYNDVAALYAAGLLREQAGEPFAPKAAADREELVYILHRLSLCLEPASAAERADLLAEELSARGEEELLTRGELAEILVRLSGREVRQTALFIAERLPPDMTMEDGNWAYIADAVTEGIVPDPAPGVHRIYGWLYATWEDGTLVTDMDYGVWTFGVDGRYTTGSPELDDYLAEYLDISGASRLPDEEALQAAYLYVKYNYVYQIRPEDMEGEGVGEMGWEYERALRFFRYGGGPCYGYSAAFGLMARALGYTAYIVSAQVNEYHGPHAFVVIPEGDIDYIYDVELEATRQERHPDLSLFRILNFTIYNYWYEPDWRDP